MKRTLLLVAVWITFAELAAPALIELAWSSDTLGRIEEVRNARVEQSLDYLVGRWRGGARWATVAWLFYLCISWASRRPRWARRLAGSETPGTLAFIRIVVCGVLFVLTLAERLPSTAYLPREMIHAPGFLEIFYLLPTGLEHLVASPLFLGALQGATALLLLLGALGARTRLVLPAAAVAYLFLGAIPRQYSAFYHQGLLPLLLLAVLCWTPAGDAWSLDRLSRRAAGLSVPAAHRRRAIYGWSRFACLATIALCYFQSGASKLRRSGLDWLDPDNLRAILVRDTLSPMSFQWDFSLRLIDAPDTLLILMAAGAVAVELLFPLILVSRRLRPIFALGALGLHVGILLGQRILFLDLMLLQLLLLDCRRLRLAWARTLRRRGLARAAPRALEAFALRLCSSGGSGPAPDPVGLWPRRLRRIAGFLLLCWAFRLEAYPLTAWQMYSAAESPGVVEYPRVVATFASGREARAPLEEGIAAMDRPLVAGTRYRRLIERSLDGRDREVAEYFLTACGERYNRLHPDDPILGFRVQKRRWELHRRRDDPGRGEVASEFRLDLANPD